MQINKVRQSLTVLSPAKGNNKYGSCTTCAVWAADALVTGFAPTIMAKSSSDVADEAAIRNGVKRVLGLLPDHMALRPDHSRGYLVWKWLNKATNGVYLFENEVDHVYNYVVDGAIYLIDSSTQVFRKVNTPGDCCVATKGYPVDYSEGVGNTDFGFNYLNAQPVGEDDDFDRLCVYWWGPLHSVWK